MISVDSQTVIASVLLKVSGKSLVFWVQRHSHEAFGFGDIVEIGALF